MNCNLVFFRRRWHSTRTEPRRFDERIGQLLFVVVHWTSRLLWNVGATETTEEARHHFVDHAVIPTKIRSNCDSHQSEQRGDGYVRLRVWIEEVVDETGERYDGYCKYDYLVLTSDLRSPVGSVHWSRNAWSFFPL